mgnify:CR=1 FL=1
MYVTLHTEERARVVKESEHEFFEDTSMHSAALAPRKEIRRKVTESSRGVNHAVSLAGHMIDGR